MIRKDFCDYPNGWVFDTRYNLELSDNEQERLKEILKELQEMFMADGVSFDIPELTISDRRDYTITIHGGINTAHTFGGGPNEW